MKSYIVPTMLLVDAPSADDAADLAGRMCGWHDRDGARIGVLIDGRLEPEPYDPDAYDPQSIADLPGFQTADPRRVLARLLANHKRLTDWMRERTGPSDGTLEMLSDALAIAAMAQRTLADPADLAPQETDA